MQVTDELLYRYAPVAERLWLSQLPRDDHIPVHHFSRRFRRRMGRLIRDQRRSPAARRLLSAARRAAVIALVVSVLSFSCLMTVKAYRVKLIEIVTEIFDNTVDFWIGPKRGGGAGRVQDVIFGYLPEDLEEIDRLDLTPHQGMFLTYIDPDGRLLDINVWVVAGQSSLLISINTEGAVVSSTAINGQEASLYTSADGIQLMWEEEDCLILITSELSYDETVKVAQNLRLVR